jgi:hypothetical protein
MIMTGMGSGICRRTLPVAAAGDSAGRERVVADDAPLGADHIHARRTTGMFLRACSRSQSFNVGWPQSNAVES